MADLFELVVRVVILLIRLVFLAVFFIAVLIWPRKDRSVPYWSCVRRRCSEWLSLFCTVGSLTGAMGWGTWGRS